MHFFPSFLPIVKKKKPADETHYLLAELKKTEDDIEKASISFRQAVDPLLIDCYIYEWYAAQKKYQYLVQTAKNLGIQADRIRPAEHISDIPAVRPLLLSDRPCDLL